MKSLRKRFFANETTVYEEAPRTMDGVSKWTTDGLTMTCYEIEKHMRQHDLYWADERMAEFQYFQPDKPARIICGPSNVDLQAVLKIVAEMELKEVTLETPTHYYETSDDCLKFEECAPESLALLSTKSIHYMGTMTT